MKLNNKVYDVLKWVTMIVLPAAGTLYTVLAGIWGFPYADQIGSTISGVVTFLGILLGVSSANYKKSKIIEEKNNTVEEVK